MKELIQEICKQEGKRHQASVGDVREILKILKEKIMAPNAKGMAHMDAFKKYIETPARKPKKQKASK